MSREIKFRLWDSGNKKMITNSVCYNLSLGTDGSVKAGISGDVLMQYTGLKDKNGKEIYEGDIFDFFGIINVVIFKDAMFCYDSYRTNKVLENIVPLSNYHFKWENNKSNVVKVIGNIYENPDLLIKNQ